MRRLAHALFSQSDEVPVNSNTPLEADVASIRTDLSHFRDEFRAVIARIDHDIRTLAARAETGLQSALARIDEQFREIRQDIRELRAECKSLRDKSDSLYEKIDANHASLNAKIDDMRADMMEMRGSIADLRAMQKAILWLLGGLVTLATLSITAAKAFHWA